MCRTIVTVVIGLALFSCRFEAQQRAREAALRDDLIEMRRAIASFHEDKQRYPDSLQELVNEHYLRRIPSDPITTRDDWIEVRDPDGVVNVKSAAKGYRGW